MRARASVGRRFGIVAITIGAIAFGLGVGGVARGFAEGGFSGAWVGFIYGMLFFLPGAPLLLLGFRVVRQNARASN